MIQKYYNCELLSDVILNRSIATEGNIRSLDYIPGSNFLGIAAASLYDSLTPEQQIEFFHSGQISFGDATVRCGDALSFPVPYLFYMDKLEKEIGKDPVYLHHLVDNSILSSANGRKKQLKQLRNGYVTSSGQIVTDIPTTFSLKSSQDRSTRTSKKGALFGFDALKAGQNYIFSIIYSRPEQAEIIDKAIIGTKRLGKSKNAQYGQIRISRTDTPVLESSFARENSDILVYAQSNLYITDEFGQPTFRPSAEQLGLSGGEICWKRSQIRSFAYSPWNGKRSTTSTQRHCIARGSVFYVKNAPKPQRDTQLIGGYIAEGLGRVWYDPFFLKPGSEGSAILTDLTRAQLHISKADEEKDVNGSSNHPLYRYLLKRKQSRDAELMIAEKVDMYIHSESEEINSLKRISSSQWGAIRSFASTENDINELYQKLFDPDKGYLTHGVADLKYWGKNKGRNLRQFSVIFNDNRKLGPAFIEKFAAEMAKVCSKKD